MWIVIWVFLLLRKSDCYLRTSFKTIHEIPCDQRLPWFRTDAETVILPSCLADRGYWVSFLRAQNPMVQIYFAQSLGDEIIDQGASGLVLKPSDPADVKVRRAYLRLMVELKEEKVMDDLIQAGALKTNDVIILRDPSLLADDGFMMKLSALYYGKGVQWAFLCDDLAQEGAERYSELFWEWAHNGATGIDFRCTQKVRSLVRSLSLPRDMKLSLDKLLGRRVSEAYQFDSFPFRYTNELGAAESLPGRLGPDYGPAILVVINPRPVWPHRLAYHGFANERNLLGIRDDGWKLKGCQVRCYYGKGVYTSPSFIVALKHYGCTIQLSNGHFYRVGLQVALRNEQIHPSSYGHRQHDPQWQDYATEASNFRGDAPEILVPNPEDVQVVGFVFVEIIFRSLLPRKTSFYHRT